MKRYYEHNAEPFGLSNIDFVKVVRNKNTKYSYECGRETSGFVYVVSGALEFTLVDSGKTERIDAGALAFYPRGTRYKSEYVEESTTIIIAQFDMAYGKLPPPLDRVGVFLTHDLGRLFEDVFFEGEVHTSDGLSAAFCSYKMHEIIYRTLYTLNKPERKFRKLTPALSDMQKNYVKQRKISEYAEMCSMSEAGFRRLFGEYTSLSPIEYRNNIRLEVARKLIDTGEYLVEEAALAVGYTNISFFCRNFKSRYGKTPLGSQ